MTLDYVVVEIFVLVMVGIIGSAVCEKLSHAGEPNYINKKHPDRKHV
jgi:hypothetical protein